MYFLYLQNLSYRNASIGRVDVLPSSSSAVSRPSCNSFDNFPIFRMLFTVFPLFPFFSFAFAPQQKDAEQQQKRYNHSQQFDFPIQALHLFLRRRQSGVVRQGNAVTAHKRRWVLMPYGVHVTSVQ